MNITTFSSAEWGSIRVVMRESESWFVGKDIAEKLGYSNVGDALSKHVDREDKDIIQKSQNATLEIPNRGLAIINESGLYSLILGSKLPSAKKFKHWVTSEVLPSIRKNGGYIANQESLSDDELLERALLVAHRKIEQRNKEIAYQKEQIKEMQPKALFADAVSSSSNSILVRDMAKLLKQNGVDIGEKRLFEYLRNNGYLIKRPGADYNSPTQRSMELGLFEIKETVVTHAKDTRVHKTSKITGKGQRYFIEKFIGRN